MPDSKEPVPELESRRAWVVAAHLFRQGRLAQASTEAERARRLSASLPERRMHVAMLACLIASHRGDHALASERCGEAGAHLEASKHSMLRLEFTLIAAEAAVARRDVVTARARVEEAARLLGSEPREEGWRLPALRAAVHTLEQRPAEADRSALSRELERLRLDWGEPDFAAWQRRADVRWLLEAAGTVQGVARR